MVNTVHAIEYFSQDSVVRSFRSNHPRHVRSNQLCHCRANAIRKRGRLGWSRFSASLPARGGRGRRLLDCPRKSRASDFHSSSASYSQSSWAALNSRPSFLALRCLFFRSKKLGCAAIFGAKRSKNARKDWSLAGENSQTEIWSALITRKGRGELGKAARKAERRRWSTDRKGKRRSITEQGYRRLQTEQVQAHGQDGTLRE